MSEREPASAGPVPRSFRRDSRLFLAIALLLILFLNLVTLLFFRGAVGWGSQQIERRASEILRRVALATGEPRDALERVALESDVVFVALYGVDGRKVRGSGRETEVPPRLPLAPLERGRVRTEWKKTPSLLVAAFSAPQGTFVVALDPGPGAALRTDARWATVLVPLAGAAFAVLAWLYLRSLLAPYDRLLRAAGSAPPSSSPGLVHQDERGFVIARFEATIAALSQKERELQTLARREKERADDLEIAAHTLARNLPTGLLSVDRDGRVVALNQAGSEILGLTGAVRGEPCESVLAGIPELQELVRSVLAERSVIARREIDWRHAGEERVIGVTATPAEGADGRFLGVLALFSDVSEIRRLEARVALARHLADLGNVSAGAAHEFRNAAATIDGFADLALRNPERAPEHLKAIRREAQEMSRVTRDFLLFAKPESFVPERVGLAGVAESAAEETERTFPSVRVERSGDFPEVPGSTVLLRRALVNMLRNAVEATPPERRREDGAIVLAGSERGGEVLVSVADRGAGVDPSQREKIFLPFYSTKPEGIGFGLAIVARIAELHAGTVEVNARPGGGSVFALRLPCSPLSFGTGSG